LCMLKKANQISAVLLLGSFVAVAVVYS